MQRGLVVECPLYRSVNREESRTGKEGSRREPFAGEMSGVVQIETQMMHLLRKPEAHIPSLRFSVASGLMYTSFHRVIHAVPAEDLFGSRVGVLPTTRPKRLTDPLPCPPPWMRPKVPCRKLTAVK